MTPDMSRAAHISYKALTVQQPWAWAIIYGGKDVENRTQAWTYRGPLAIHAGTRISHRGMDTVPQIAAAEQTSHPEWIRRQMDGALITGAIIGIVDLIDAHPSGVGLSCCESWWAETQYDDPAGTTRRHIVHLVLANPRPLLEPIPCRGALGLWTPTADVLARLVGEGI